MTNKRFNMIIHYDKASMDLNPYFSFTESEYEVFGNNSWKVVIYIIIAFVYLGIGFLLYKKCSGNARSLDENEDTYTSVN